MGNEGVIVGFVESRPPLVGQSPHCNFISRHNAPFLFNTFYPLRNSRHLWSTTHATTFEYLTPSFIVQA